ncbi:Zinc finger, GRF-type [Metarhizium rileyi]|uniref:Zinc finger, GRF-type n=1 Tax=Metarhizium rileyi (strain RCEF 4871) TaxID=1649241 RepID=A0A167E3I4_METRR|nr:Zinc finger, GRF-type [Metarhizium rileyi RCEF 4871]TWU76890.1 hypothetical protein ED733_006628 [Metarhizium rileyi]
MFSTPVSRLKVQDNPVSEKKRLDGVWQDRQWWCNCDPREKATLREVKKQGPNEGRLFWTCAKYPFCDFFLWRDGDEALVRESGLAVGSDTNSVNDQTVPPRPKTPTLTQKSLESYGIQTTPSRLPVVPGSIVWTSKVAGSSSTSTQARTVREQAVTSMTEPSTPSSKRKRNRRGSLDQDEDHFSDFDSDEERQLAEMTDSSAQKDLPRRPLDDIFTTPSTNRHTADIVGGLPTPSVSRTLFPASEAKRSKSVSFEEPSPSDAPTTPSKMTSSLSNIDDLGCPSSSPSDVTAPDETGKIMALLGGQKIDATVLHDIRGLLRTLARRTKGISMGRDAVRTELKEKDKKISQLQEKIRDLEKTAAHSHKQMTNVKAQLIRMYEDN